MASLTGTYVARLLGAPVGRWLHLAVLPVLFALGAGKLTMALGGAGQGQPDAAAWATAYLGPGPWGSLAPALPSVPSQILEGIVTLAIALVLGLALAFGAFRSRDGRALFVGLGLWATGRALVALTWRDPAVRRAVAHGFGHRASASPSGVSSIVVAMTAVGSARRRGTGPLPRRTIATHRPRSNRSGPMPGSRPTF